MYKIKNQKAIVNDADVNSYIEKRSNQALVAVVKKILSGDVARRIIENANAEEEFSMDFEDAVALKNALISANNFRIAVKCIPEKPEFSDFQGVVAAVETKVDNRHLGVKNSREEIEERLKLMFSVNYLPDIFVSDISANKLPKLKNITVA